VGPDSESNLGPDESGSTAQTLGSTIERERGIDNVDGVQLEVL